MHTHTQLTQQRPVTCAQCLDITCASSGRGHLVFGDAEGVITLVDRDFRLYPFQVRHPNNSMLQLCCCCHATSLSHSRCWLQAFKHHVNHVVQLKHSDVLIAIGDGIDPRPLAEQLQVCLSLPHVQPCWLPTTSRNGVLPHAHTHRAVALLALPRTGVDERQ